MTEKPNTAIKDYPAKTGERPSLVEPGVQSLSASAPSMAQGWMDRMGDSGSVSVSPNDLTSLSALIAHTATKLGVSEFRVERDLADHFNVPNIKYLPSTRFDAALRHLVDLFPEDHC